MAADFGGLGPAEEGYLYDPHAAKELLEVAVCQQLLTNLQQI